MKQESKDINWDKLLESLEQNQIKGEFLTESEKLLLIELNTIKAEASDVLKDYRDYDTEKHWLELKARIKPHANKIRVLKYWKRISVAAAAALFIFGTCLYFYRNVILSSSKANSIMLSLSKHDIAPGKNAATLTLANGKKIILSGAVNGELAEEAGIHIVKTADGKLVYEIKDQNKNQPDKINTLSTGKGETYQVRLPDGSLVWLNAASSLTYATALNKGGERRVELRGEAYFEVAKSFDKLRMIRRPFIVVTDKQEVEVLGTHFNINSYTDEASTKTTLLEGSVRVITLSLSKHALRHPSSSAGQGDMEQAQYDVKQVQHDNSTILKPGQQSILTGAAIKVTQADTELETAWKNGDFIFRGETLESIMREIARWYNVEVTYTSEGLKNIHLEGIISRSRNLSAVLGLMESTGSVKFKIEGRRVIILK